MRRNDFAPWVKRPCWLARTGHLLRRRLWTVPVQTSYLCKTPQMAGPNSQPTLISRSYRTAAPPLKRWRRKEKAARSNTSQMRIAGLRCAARIPDTSSVECRCAFVPTSVGVRYRRTGTVSRGLRALRSRRSPTIFSKIHDHYLGMLDLSMGSDRRVHPRGVESRGVAEGVPMLFTEECWSFFIKRYAPTPFANTPKYFSRCR